MTDPAIQSIVPPPLSTTDEMVLRRMPHFIAINYQRLLDAQTCEEQVKIGLHIYNLGLRALTIALVSQYLIRDQERVCDPYLNDLLLRTFPHLTIDTWQKLLFATLRAYEGHEDLFFMPELYKFYWDTSVVPHKRRTEVRRPFDRLTQITMDLRKEELRPKDEAGWQKLADECRGLLQEILWELRYLAEYDLIRVLRFDAARYDFELHKGLSISRGTLPVPKSGELTVGWFYMREDTGELLVLHPFLVFWPQEPVSSELVSWDTGVYENFIYERLQYLLASVNKTAPVIDGTSISYFGKVLYDTIEDHKRQRELAAKLTWPRLQDLCEEITKQRMATVRASKYDSRRYLQRQQAWQAFQDFLNSDKRCFVLTGKSGVGKSNFLLALGEDLASDGNSCLLMYDGGQLRLEPSLTATISQDFDDRLRLADRRIDNIWREIAEVDGIQGRRVILVVDAINENMQPKALLRQLDDLVAGPWPWLKVVFSSRPETWRTIKSGVKMAEDLYYRADRTGSVGVELQQFSYSQQLDEFSSQELPLAYGKYWLVFGLQTPYEKLSHDVRQMLRDPFNLWLVAKTYRLESEYAGQIPATLRASQLVRNYVESEDILKREDRRFLETQLVPLLFAGDSYKNALSIADIDRGGPALYDAVFSKQILSDGTMVNQSFQNLVDADVLSLEGQGSKERIAFTYERFCEFFAGHYMYTRANPSSGPLPHAEKVAWYAKVASELNKHVYLWGALVQALIRELESGEPVLPLLADLSPGAESNRLLRSALVTAVCQDGVDNPERARRITEELLGNLSPPPSTWSGQLAQIIRGPNGQLSEASMRQRVALEAAGRLGMADLLELAATDLSPKLRAVAALNLFYLCNRDRAAGLRAVDHLSRRVVGPLGLPDRGTAESLLGISGALLGLEDDDKVLTELLAMGRRTLRRMLLLDLAERGNPAWRIIPPGLLRLMREQILSLLVTYVLKLMAGWRQDVWLSLEGLNHFFTLSQEQKDLLASLVPFLDGTKPGLAEKVPDMIQAERSGDLLAQCIIEFPFMTHAAVDAEATLPALEALVDASLSTDLPAFWTGGATNQACAGTMRSPHPDRRFLQLHERCVAAIQKDVRAWLDMAKRSRPVPLASDTRAINLYTLVATSYVVCGKVDSDLLTITIEKAKKEKDNELLKAYIDVEVTPAFELGLPEAAYQALELVSNYKGEAVVESMVKLLVRIYRSNPEVVEGWLYQGVFSPDVVERVLAYPPDDTLNDQVSYQLLTPLYNLFMLGPRSLLAEMQWFLLQALRLRNTREWFSIIGKELLNLLCGELAFSVPPDAPSRRYLAEGAASVSHLAKS